MTSKKSKTNDENTLIKIGTRTSRLALAQVAEVHLLLSQYFPKIKVEIIPISTTGDKIIDRNLAEFGGKGLFIKELEEALLNNDIDLAIHSAKDVPPEISKDTEISAYTTRIDPRDCLISKNYQEIDELPKNAVIGTSSPRRTAMLLKQRSDLKIVNFRGNVDTRIKKTIDLQEVDATILAVAGLERLEKNQLIKKPIAIEQMIPSGGQGSLAIQIRKDDEKIKNITKKINDQNTDICITAERTFLRELHASCNTPIGVYGEIIDQRLKLRIMILDFDGKAYYQASGSCLPSLDQAIKIGRDLANQTKKEAQELWKKITSKKY